jgi:hypothetical protein
MADRVNRARWNSQGQDGEISWSLMVRNNDRVRQIYGVINVAYPIASFLIPQIRDIDCLNILKWFNNYTIKGRMCSLVPCYFDE